MPGASRRCKRPSRSEASPSECGRPRLDDAKWTRVKRGETDIHPGTTLACVMSAQNGSAGKGIRTLELLRDWTLNPAPLTWLGNPRVDIYRCRENYTCSLEAAPRTPEEAGRFWRASSAREANIFPVYPGSGKQRERKSFCEGLHIPELMVRHECGFEAPIYCKRCGRPLSCDERTGGLFCPHCGRRVSLLCPGCGRLW